jgi:two-component system, cell cycle response regulator
LIVADDSLTSRIAIQRLLKNLEFDIRIASEGLQAWQLLQADDVPTVAILDWMMPGIEGVELCRRIRQLSRQHYTYIILLTGKSSRQDVIAGLQAGADDYMTKPFDAQQLYARLLVAERIIRFQEELVAAREVLRNQAKHDYLTRALNRAGIMEVLEQQMARSRRTGEPFSVILGDIDHFKQVNDRFGHLTGDDVLAEVASRIRSCTRSYDSVGRYGGEEFLVIAPGCDEDGAFQVAEKIRIALAQAPFSAQHGQLTVTMSLGVRARDAETSIEAMLLSADSALYRAKESGRNCTRTGKESVRAHSL